MRGLKESMQDVMDRRRRPPLVTKTLGMKLTGYGGGRASMEMTVGRKFHNPMGTLHGGIMTDIADATMGVALMSTLRAQRDLHDPRAEDELPSARL